MRVLFAVNNEKISESIVRKYQADYKEIISAKNVYYFNAIIKELQRNRNYDRIVISEDLEPYSNKNYEMIDKFLFEKLDNISDEASNNTDGDIPIILICTDRREKGEVILTKLFSIGLYSALIGQDRTIENLCALINKPRSKRDAKVYYKIDAEGTDYKPESDDEVNETEVQNILNHFKKLGKNENAYITAFNNIATQYNEQQLKLIVEYLPLNVRAVLEEECAAYQQLMLASVKGKIKEKKEKSITTKNLNVPQRNENNIDLINRTLQKPRMTSPVVIPSSIDTNNVKKIYSQNPNDGSEEKIRRTIVVGSIKPRSSMTYTAANEIQDELDDINNNKADTFDTQDTVDTLDSVNTLDSLDSIESEFNETINNLGYDTQSQVNGSIDNIDTTLPMPEKEDAETTIDNLIGSEFENDSDETSVDSVETVKMPTDAEETPKKRGRGRPPKIKTAESGILPGFDSAAEALPKRGRGRPRKNVPQEEPTVTLDTEENNDEIDLFSLGDDEKTSSIEEPAVNSEETSDIDLFSLDNEEKVTSTESSDDKLSSDINLFSLEDDDSEEESTESTIPQENNTEVSTSGIEETQNMYTDTSINGTAPQTPDISGKSDDLDLFGLSSSEKETNVEVNTTTQSDNNEDDVDLFSLSSQDNSFENTQPSMSESNMNNMQNQSDNEPLTFSANASPSYGGGYSSNMSSSTSSIGYESRSNNMQANNLINISNYDDRNFAELLTSDKKLVAFVGTSKNGTSFLVNNVASLMASKGINTAILDLTRNKNAYYIYTQNDENLRGQASICIERLRSGAANGINVEKNLTVYTTLPNEESGIEDYSNILQTLVKNYSLVILDCDFNSNYNYFAAAQEIYLVQSYDILTIQPLTAFLRELEDKNVINPNKLRVVVNKALKVRNLNEKMIIGGISKYNSPDMTYQKDLFDINTIMYTVVPFEDQTYAKYLEGLVTCNISLNGYSKGLLDALEGLGSMVYPLIPKKPTGGKGYNNYNGYNNNEGQSQFNSSIDSTLNKMRNSF